MTADVELLPLPPLGECSEDSVQEWGRANLAHATAAKDAEIEALRAEVEDWRRQRAAAERDACRLASRLNASEKRAETVLAEAFEWRDKFSAEKARAEQLEEALRLALKWAEVLPPGEPLRKESEADLSAARAALDPTAAQENDDA